jgi:hypothetical protein
LRGGRTEQLDGEEHLPAGGVVALPGEGVLQVRDDLDVAELADHVGGAGPHHGVGVGKEDGGPFQRLGVETSLT